MDIFTNIKLPKIIVLSTCYCVSSQREMFTLPCYKTFEVIQRKLVVTEFNIHLFAILLNLM